MCHANYVQLAGAGAHPVTLCSRLGSSCSCLALSCSANFIRDWPEFIHDAACGALIDSLGHGCGGASRDAQRNQRVLKWQPQAACPAFPPVRLHLSYGSFDR